MFFNRKKAPKPLKAKKPTKKAAGAKAPVAPTPVVEPNPDPPPRPADPPRAEKPLKGLSPEEEISEINKQILSLQARIWELEHPFQEFPKMVKGVTFLTREDQDKAGPEYADKKDKK